MVQIEPLEVLLEELVLRQTIIAHPPVRRDRSVEYVKWHLLRIDAQIRSYKRRDGHVLARAAEALVIARVLRLVQLIRHRIQAFRNQDSVGLNEVIPQLRIEFIFHVVLYKCGVPAHHGRRELSRFIRGIVHEFVQHLIEAEETRVVLADVAVGGQFDF